MTAKIIHLFALSGVILLTSYACTDMNYLHDDYLKRGETIYVGRPDSVKTFPGKERIKIQYWLSDPKAVYLVINFASGRDSVLLNVPPHPLKDSLEVYLDNLPEEDYLLELVTMNKDFRHRSIPYQISASSYGAIFQEGLVNRIISSATVIEGDSVEIKWLGAVENGLGSELIYKDKAGKDNKVFIPMSERISKIADFSSGLEYRTAFLPEEHAIDTFYTDFQPIVVQ